ncbi:hypothetical protein AB0M96_35130, partial [Streptomyces sp. NPDC051098]
DGAASLAPLVTEKLLTEAAADVPDEWLIDEPGFETTDALRRAYVEPLLARAATIHERITLTAPSKPRPSQAPGWLTEHLTPWPHPTKAQKAAGE